MDYYLMTYKEKGMKIPVLKITTSGSRQGAIDRFYASYRKSMKRTKQKEKSKAQFLAVTKFNIDHGPSPDHAVKSYS